MSLRDRLEPAFLRVLMNLPEPVQRRLAGPPLTVEGATLAAESQLMLRLQRLAGEPAVESLPIPEGRVALERQSALVAGVQPIGSVRELWAAGRPARLYVPRAVVASGPDRPGPLLVFFHGGGWIYGSLDSHDASCRVLAERAGVRVLSVDYRLAPEHPYPAAYDDCLAACRWVVEHAARVGADPERLAVGGDSAGGNLAAAVALAAAGEGLPLRFQLLVYPGTDMSGSMASRRTFAEGLYLTARFIELSRESYLPDRSRESEPQASPLVAEVPAGLAPAYVCTAGFDPLRDEGEAYARRLQEAGVACELRRFEDQIHGFFNAVGVGRRTRACVAEVADALAAGLRGPAQ